jgi:hypothetical protein
LDNGLAKKLLAPVFVTWVNKKGDLTKLGTGSYTIGNKMKTLEELNNIFSEEFLNEAIEQKNDSYPTHRMIVVLKRTQFAGDSAFSRIVTELKYFDNKKTYVICSWINFENPKQKLNCIENPCNVCSTLSNFPYQCIHSCLPRLLHLIHNEDETVKDMLLKMWQ